MPDEVPRPPDEQVRPRDSIGYKDVWKFLGLGLQLGVTVGLFVILGWWLDQHYGWSPYGILGFGVTGVAAGMYHFLKDSMR